MAEIGPVPAVPPATRYVLDVNAAAFSPDMKAEVARQVHTHPGPEIFYLLTGEQCLETPTGTTRARAGEGMVAPANTPMQLNIVGAERRDAFLSSFTLPTNHGSLHPIVYQRARVTDNGQRTFTTGC